MDEIKTEAAGEPSTPDLKVVKGSGEPHVRDLRDLFTNLGALQQREAAKKRTLRLVRKLLPK